MSTLPQKKKHQIVRIKKNLKKPLDTACGTS
ncbi:hypothetical protein TRM7615_04734 [Falsiruegeria mediterranea M17]|uniref:Uncharacterized protein n=1 Tax=Falsiruegeria mediterranea M17 TaxID=1200281 RepID=A0A2R8CFF4_9RHOB|nr:hypothetical protein TRM7615_04734 [Falsiruegeria mediterranea M17]